MPPPPKLSLAEIAVAITADGPTKQEPANRRVRGLFSSQWLFDTTDALYVWEHPYYPQFYIPLKALEAGPSEISKQTSDAEGNYWLGTLRLGSASFQVAGFDRGPLEGYVKLPNNAIDSWFVEDERQLGPHPKDPYKRIECLPSSREVRVEVEGHLIAQSTNNVFLYESLLKPRYYLPRTSVVDWATLLPSETTSFCPYKGQASYYDIVVGDTKIQDAVWYYPYPTAESVAVQDRLCFYSERVGVWVDGEKV